MSGRMSRAKGARGEREVLELYREHGFDGTRGFQSGGQGGGDLFGDMPDLVEVKYVEQVRFWSFIDQAASAIIEAAAVLESVRRLRQAQKSFVVWIRSNGRPWMTVLPWWRYMELIEKERELDGGKR